jgi:hypothetical protein
LKKKNEMMEGENLNLQSQFLICEQIRVEQENREQQAHFQYENEIKELKENVERKEYTL